MKLIESSKQELASLQERFTLASNVYENNPSNSSPLPGGWQREFISTEVSGLEKNGFYGAVYHRTINGTDEHIVAFRGMNGMNDLKAVTMLAIGQPPAQLSDAYKFVQIASDKLKFDPAKASYVGHSMGGYLAKAVGLLNQSQDIASFNAPGLFHEDLQRIPRRINREFHENKSNITVAQIDDNVTSVNAKYDVVSMIGNHHGNQWIIKAQGPQHQLLSLEKSFNRTASGEVPEAPPRRVAATVGSPEWGIGAYAPG